MDWTYFGKLGISVLIFAPGLILMTGLLFVGLVMLIEKAGAMVSRTRHASGSLPVETRSQNPSAGPIVEGLNDAVVETPEQSKGPRAIKAG